MAIYYTMGIDCGTDRRLAERIVKHFDGLPLPVAGCAPVVCEAYAEVHRHLWFVRVYPRGMGHATLPDSNRRPELATEAMESEVRRRLYAELPPVAGFRRAMFGAECFDQMAFATPDEDSEIDYGFMISSVTHFPDAPFDCTVERFADGYRIVIRQGRRQSE